MSRLRTRSKLGQHLPTKTKKVSRRNLLTFEIMVGVQGFEPWTPCSQSRCATRLRYTPTISILTSTRARLSRAVIYFLFCLVSITFMSKQLPTLSWMEPGDPFPDVRSAWDANSDAPGLLAAGGDLSVNSLRNAYADGIFPWFSEGQPNLWWSPDPRMVLEVSNFRLHRSLRKTLARFANAAHCEVRFDTAFESVLNNCARVTRKGQPGTWILPPMVEAYTRLHRAGFAHSVETWIDGKLVGGLYCVALGKAVFGESMFTQVHDASKIALAALVSFCRHQGVEFIDCQQNTTHLASLGAAEMPRSCFLSHIHDAQFAPELEWRFTPLYWNNILSA